MTIKFVYFDIGNVLLRFHGGLQKLADKHGKTFNEFERIFRKYDDQVCRGSITPQELWHKYEQELNIRENDFNFSRYWVSCCVPIDESFDIVTDLCKTNIKVGLLSNLYLNIYEEIQDQKLFPPISWDSRVISSEVHISKPDPQIYNVAEERCNCLPENILFIDDKPEFLKPAKEKGWNTFLFDEKNSINSASELRQLLGI